MSKEKAFSYKQALKFSLNAFIDNFSFYFKVYLIFLGISTLLSISFIGFFYLAHQQVPHLLYFYRMPYQPGEITRYFFKLSPLAFFIILMVKEYFHAALIRTSFIIYSTNQKLFLRDFFSLSFDTFIRFFAARIWYYLKTIIGLILLIIPGIYIALKYYFTGFFIIEREATISQDILMNRELTQNIKWSLLLLYILLYTLTTVLVLGVITLIVYPLIPLIQVHIYNQLLYNHQIQDVRDL